MGSVGSPKDWQNSTTLYGPKSQLAVFFGLSVNNGRLHSRLKGHLTNFFYLGLYHLLCKIVRIKFCLLRNENVIRLC